MVIPLTYGRMGNFLFQAACAISYGLKHGLEYTVPSSTNDAKWNPIYLRHLVNPKYNPALAVIRIPERRFTYQELPFKEGWRDANIVLDGYWQTEKYFKEYRQQIIEAFGFKWECWQGWVSVHVRRGDYLTIQKNGQFKHPPVPKEWIEKAMACFEGFRFRFFSDDIDWCLSEFGDRTDCAFSKKGTPEEQDLVLMSCCEHHICSASTFSWWGAWLNQNPEKRVIMPAHWLSPGWGNLDTSDVVPPEWERLSL